MDVSARRLITRPPDVVARYAMDWRHDHEWTRGIERAELSAPAPGGGFGVGAEVTRTARFLGKRLDYVLRVVAHEPPALLEMKSVAGPFPMHVTYRFDAAHAGTTMASIRVRGDAGGHYRPAGPLLARFVRAALRKDLRDLARHVG
ncbi:SRPBCC family protein [Saccharothrix sp. S26]|uniref:SRPBCC family protein n=1 Tax=Saccharothrix sp. S26 TaxID=2907215 RepID=UPI001F20EAA3|nr:SRPBCC family protein [Saccharothrix sp. S26]MCE6994061.1 SRPBCC family protein [Saccharothrix sp. S26]